jgi:tRNA(fMet)-specific endonuclease VapC
MAKRVVVDTSVIIENLRTDEGIFWEIIAELAISEIEVFIPAAVWTELWTGASTVRPEVRREFNYFLSLMKFVPVTPEIAQRAGELERDKLCEGNDATIAATALELNAALVTLNTKHFQKITGLKLY